jgi:hypothetical protein
VNPIQIKNRSFRDIRDIRNIRDIKIRDFKKERLISNNYQSIISKKKNNVFLLNLKFKKKSFHNLFYFISLVSKILLYIN